MKKHKDRKKRAKQKQKPVKSASFLPSTIKGITGERKDRYAEQTVNHINDSLDLMHTNGIPVKENSVKRGISYHIFPFIGSVQNQKMLLIPSFFTLLRQESLRQTETPTFREIFKNQRHAGNLCL